MRKFNLKTRMQWGWFKSALIGTLIGLLIAPTAGNIIETAKNQTTQKKQERDKAPLFSGIAFGDKVKVIINGEVVALAKNEEIARQAFKDARLRYNADGVKVLDIVVDYETVDKEQDKDAIKRMRVLSAEQLSDAILETLDTYQEDKQLAYTMRIDDYTVTIDKLENLISILEQAQGQYDAEDAFKVELNPPASRNVTMYEVDVVSKEADQNEDATTKETGSEESEDAADNHINKIAPVAVRMTGAEAEEGQEAEDEESGDEEEVSSDKDEESGQDAEESVPAGQGEATEENPSVTKQAENDGVKHIGFSDTIQVIETYVAKDQIKDKDTAYNELTAKNDEETIYVVEPGDCLDLIAEKTNMSVEQIKELNPGIESDANLYYDDRLNVTIPKAAVQILVQKQETYQEEYNEEVVYEDDDSMYIGETEVVQEGSSGKHIVTDLVTYKDNIECDRQQLEETVEVAAVAQVVRRGTKSKPTYMYPVTNWIVTSTFGSRWGRLHAGIDVGVPTGTTVRASRGGQVTNAGWIGGYGYCVVIDHGDGVVTYYGHLSEITTSVGQYVDQGQQIALSGNTGRSTGPHLHFEIRVNGISVDPAPYLGN